MSLIQLTVLCNNLFVSKKQIVLVIFTPIILVISWLALDLFLAASQPHNGACIVLCAYSYDRFWGDCCTNGIFQKTVGVYLYPYAGLIEFGVLALELISAIFLLKKWKRKDRRK